MKQKRSVSENFDNTYVSINSKEKGSQMFAPDEHSLKKSVISTIAIHNVLRATEGSPIAVIGSCSSKLNVSMQIVMTDYRYI